jgi:hypothetical protein
VIAFVGPSISRPEVERACPGLDVRPPVRRDDLYRAREQGAWGFVIIDGVFMQEDALSPREVVDVLEDGAFVLGAASMGALRAADCWPAGARGVGLIYRLYRRGVLQSDEDVAVAVSADGADTAVSLPLVNVRYAMARAVRHGRLDRPTARRVVSAAASIHYPERTWREVWRRAGPPPAELEAYCARFDLKRDDAERALAEVRRLLADAAALAARHARHRDAPFVRSETSRERAYDATGGLDPELLRPRLLDWLIGAGRLARHWPDPTWPDAALADPDGFARAVWRHLGKARQLDAELMRLQAVDRAAGAAEAAGLAPRAEDHRRAREAIAKNHGFPTWARLQASPRGRQLAVPIAAAADRLARAKRMRDPWFHSPSPEPGPTRLWQKARAFLRLPFR